MEVLAAISYKKLAEIGKGEGRNSKVYLANEPQLGGQIAVKEIEKAQFGNVPEDFFTEAQTMFHATHANVVPVQYACATDTTVSLAMPYYPNGSLGKRIADRPLQLSEVLRVAQGVLAGRARIHLAGFVHFDLKPSNVLFSDTNVPMVADFGQSRTMSAEGVATVTKLYYSAMPPELVQSNAGTIHADIYQAGVLLYRALNGDQFFRSQIPADGDALRAKIEKGKFPDRQRFMPHVPRRLQTIVRKAMRVKPGERFDAATEMADKLAKVSLALDWCTEPLTDGGFRWVARRLGYADLIVELMCRSGKWDVRTFTQTVEQPRRGKDRKANWRSGLSLEAAHDHLKVVFRRLAG